MKPSHKFDKYVLQVTKLLYESKANRDYCLNEAERLLKKGISSAIYRVICWEKPPTKHIVLFRELQPSDEKWVDWEDLYDSEDVIKNRELLLELKAEKGEEENE